MLLKTVAIPEFAFSNREEEQDLILEFCTEKLPNSRVLLVEGEAGVGKTRLLHRVFSDPQLTGSVIDVNLSGEFTASLLSQLLQACRQQIAGSGSKTTKPISRTTLFTDFKLRDVVAKALSGIPYVGPLIEYVLRISKKKRSQNEEKHAIKEELLNSLDSIAADYSPLIVIDDLHAIPQQDLHELFDFLSLALSRTSSSVRFVLGTRPIHRFAPETVQSLVYRLASTSLLDRLRVQPMSLADMSDIAGSIVSNPVASRPLLDMAEGNPQYFLQLLMKLNYRGDLGADGRFLRLPNDVNNLAYLADHIWNFVQSDTAIARLVGVLSLGVAPLPLSDLPVLIDVLEVTRQQMESMLHNLKQERILEWREPTRSKVVKEPYLRFCHDTLAEQIGRRILNGDPYQRMAYSGNAASFFRQVLARSPLYDEAEIRRYAHPGHSLATIDFEVEQLYWLALNVVRAEEAGWESLALGVLRLCESKGLYAEVVKLSGVLQASDSAILSASPKIAAYIRGLIIKTHYHLGNWSRCTEESTEGIEDGEILYYYSAAVLIAKNRGRDSVAIAKSSRLLVSSRDPNHDWLPLLVSAEALCMHECGLYAESKRFYSDQLKSLSAETQDSEQWAQFLMMSPLYLEPKRSEALVRESLEFLDPESNERSVGIATHNLGFAQLMQFRWRKARRQFEKARTILETVSSHESVFPINNIAAIMLLRQQYQLAREILNQARFLRLAPFYEKQILVNLAYASWGLGLSDCQNYLDQIPDSLGLQVDPWSDWQIKYARHFLILMSREESPSQAELDAAYEELSAGKHLDALAPFWNVLARIVSKQHSLKPRLIQGVGSKRYERLILGVNLVPMRPALLCFGHI